MVLALWALAMADNTKSVAVFGATGSIGSSVMDLIARFPDRYHAHILTAGRDAAMLAELAHKFKPHHIGLADADGYDCLKDKLVGTDVQIHVGDQAVADLAAIETDLTISAITGIAGLMPTLLAVKAGHVVAIANKETLVTAGHIIMDAAKKHGATLLPIDSEHNAIFQAWTSLRTEEIHSVTLTASGGPFLETRLADLAKMTPAQAVDHPNWSMGEKISVDSATMMNKGFEVIEAAVLFDLPEDRVKTLIHPASAVHGMVHYHDGTTLAQMGHADMRVPISYALAWPERMNWGAEVIDLTVLGALEFSHPEADRFPCLDLARQALRHGGLATTVLNASNEMAVDYFLNNKIGFLDIVAMNTHMLNHIESPQLTALDDILAKDEEVRRKCDEWLHSKV
jgi:1-deoxy-D-xylulose-5-phosphate reductoisomerase